MILPDARHAYQSHDGDYVPMMLMARDRERMPPRPPSAARLMPRCRVHVDDDARDAQDVARASLMRDVIFAQPRYVCARTRHAFRYVYAVPPYVARYGMPRAHAVMLPPVTRAMMPSFYRAKHGGAYAASREVCARRR